MAAGAHGVPPGGAHGAPPGGAHGAPPGGAHGVPPGAQGVPPFHVHPGHALEGFEVVEDQDAPPLLLARCDCGAVLDVAPARFAPCPGCRGQAAGTSPCARCGGRGRVIDHAALEWQAPR